MRVKLSSYLAPLKHKLLTNHYVSLNKHFDSKLLIEIDVKGNATEWKFSKSILICMASIASQIHGFNAIMYEILYKIMRVS